MIKKLVAFSLLYVSEGIEAAIATVILPLVLAELGFNASVVGLAISITSIPWVIKILWGAIADKYSHIGRRKFILIGGLVGALTNILIFILHPNMISILIALIFVSRCGIATLDVSTDALAITISKKNERGKINGAEFLGQLFGFSIGSLYLTQVMKINSNMPFVLAAIIIFAMLPSVFLIRDANVKSGLSKLRKALDKSTLKFIFLIIAVNLPIGMLTIAAFIMKKYFGITSSSVGLIMMLASVITGIGSLIGGWLSDRFGRIKIAQISLIGYGLFTIPAIEFFIPSYFILSFFSGSLTSSLCAWCMDKTKKEVAATEYSIFTSAANLGNVIGTSLGGFLLAFMGTIYLSIIPITSLIALYSMKKLHG